MNDKTTPCGLFLKKGGGDRGTARGVARVHDRTEYAKICDVTKKAAYAAFVFGLTVEVLVWAAVW